MPLSRPELQRHHWGLPRQVSAGGTLLLPAFLTGSVLTSCSMGMCCGFAIPLHRAAPSLLSPPTAGILELVTCYVALGGPWCATPADGDVTKEC